MIVEYLRVFEKQTLVNEPLEIGNGNKVIFAAVLFSRAHLPRRIGNRYVQLGLALQERFHE
jgi:hypothetical protein